MKSFINKTKSRLISGVCLIVGLFMMNSTGFAQNDSTTVVQKSQPPSKPRPVKNTFGSSLIIDDQTVMVPAKGTFEADIQHRFGSVQTGSKDLWGIYGISNIRMGFQYAPINNLYVGIGLTKLNMLFDGSAKYAILKQTNGQSPVSLTYYGNIAVKTIANPDNVVFTYNSQRWSFFNELIVARKINDRLSVQVALSVSHQNSVPGYYTKSDTSTVVFKEQKFNMYTASFSARYKLTAGTAFIFNYDQPLTTFATNNPHPNFAFGFEFGTSGHSFQLFAGNYSMLNPQQNSLYNNNNPFGYTDNGVKVPGGQFQIGFNITRLWSF
jgi:hypothetical protein